MDKRSKIIGLGLSKTGTTSLNQALNELGFTSVHYHIDPSILERRDAITDIPAIPYYKELDRKYPRSKFVLTIRGIYSWLAAVKRNFARNNVRTISRRAVDVRLKVYGTEDYHAGKLIFAYIRHHLDVLWYFRRRRSDLLVMNITAGDGWEKLCPFLDRPPPECPFPRLNVFAEPETRVRKPSRTGLDSNAS